MKIILRFLLCNICMLYMGLFSTALEAGTEKKPVNQSSQLKPHAACFGQSTQTVESYSPPPAPGIVINPTSQIESASPIIGQHKRKLKTSNTVAKKRRDMAVMFRPTVCHQVVRHLLRTIDFLGIHHVLVDLVFGRAFHHSKLFAPGRADKWLDIRLYDKNEEQALVTEFTELGFQTITCTAEDTSEQLNSFSQREVQPTLLIIGDHCAFDKDLTRLQTLFLNANIRLGQITHLAAASRPDIQKVVARLPSLNDTSCITTLLTKTLQYNRGVFGKLIRRTDKKSSTNSWIAKHSHPSAQTERKNRTVIIMEELSEPINMFNIILLACKSAMKELHYVSKKSENHTQIDALANQLTCPVQITHHECIEPCVAQLKSRGFSIYGSVLSQEATALDHTVREPLIAVILGNEGHGMSKNAIDLSEQQVTIPQHGVTTCLNVTAAAALLVNRLQSTGPMLPRLNKSQSKMHL
ncbi:TrmH family RNA methyltransferase [Sansalvadorimonas verongulae]|uniref:TrmH family RNA methyltransferase n=1 Tax=Sansalvadorimonas verongulae TaxID=2172824 RepID=UPI0012BC95B4|nr:TrmH family RNA methyltransferase [Sansalvadorimonas verongulae]MTI12781.1 hypothetical protein [Sansalvadorimonas verongulae]